MSSGGTIYFVDRGNNRIRAIAPDGTITTIAGNGQEPTSGAPALTGLPAVQAPIGQPTAITVGPQGSIYFASEEDVLSITPDGTLVTIVDGATFDAADPGVMFDQGCYPASLAFDSSASSLYVGCSSPWRLFVRNGDGTLQDLGMIRPHDAWAAMAPAPGGGVFVVDGAEVRTYGSGPTIDRAVYEYLNYRLPGGGFFWPQGIAATGSGLYLDADGVSGIGPAAIVTGNPPGPVKFCGTTHRVAFHMDAFGGVPSKCCSGRMQLSRPARLRRDFSGSNDAPGDHEDWEWRRMSAHFESAASRLRPTSERRARTTAIAGRWTQRRSAPTRTLAECKHGRRLARLATPRTAVVGLQLFSASTDTASPAKRKPPRSSRS